MTLKRIVQGVLRRLMIPCEYFVRGLVKVLPEGLWIRVRDSRELIKNLDYDKHCIHMTVDSWIERDVRIHSVAKEPDTVEWIEKWFRKGEVFYDVGANVGAYSLIANTVLSGDGKIYAFEPGFMTYPQLCKNIKLNNASQTIVPLQLALSDKNSLLPFHYQNLTTGGALHALGEAINQKGEIFQPLFTLKTLSFSMDFLISVLGLEKPNHIKVDVDGPELSVLKGARETLKSSNVRTLLLEYNDQFPGASEIDNLLQDCGLSLLQRNGENSLYVR